MAHHGVLFLDELPEFSAQVLDSLRQPLENGEAVISRANRHVKYPSRFQLIAAANPCKCGGGSGAQACRKGPQCREAYFGRISGPFLDRIDLFVDVPAVTAIDLTLPPPKESSADIAKRVFKARERQTQRYCEASTERRRLNVDAGSRDLEEFCALDEDGQALLRMAAEKMALSARGYHRTLKVARTIADLDGQISIRRPHIAEALSYRYKPATAGVADNSDLIV